MAGPRGSPWARRGRSWHQPCAKGPPRCHPQFLAAMTTDKATPPSAMAVAPKSHFQGMDCGAEHRDVRGRARGRGHVPPRLPCLLDRTSQKGSAGDGVCRQLTALPDGQLGAKSGARSWHGRDPAGTASSTGCYQGCFPGTAPGARPPAPSGIHVLTARPHPAQQQGCVPPAGPGGHWHTPCGPPPPRALPRAVCLCTSWGCWRCWGSPASSCTSPSPRSSGPRASSPAWRAQRGWSGEDSVLLSALQHPCLPGRGPVTHSTFHHPWDVQEKLRKG